jgi:hypothetical protein
MAASDQSSLTAASSPMIMRELERTAASAKTPQPRPEGTRFAPT